MSGTSRLMLTMKTLLCGAATAIALTACLTDEGDDGGDALASHDEALALPGHLPAPNRFGAAATTSALGTIDLDSAFFADLGSNGRACDDCHSIAAGWSITPAQLKVRFAFTGGHDPIFRLNDGANSPLAPVATFEERRRAYRMLLDRGTIRVGLTVPATAEFELVAVDDPYGYASASELSLFRRPLPATNLRYLTTVMWDGRENPAAGTSLDAALAHQANGATLGHAQATVGPDPMVLDEIVGFEQALTTAQVFGLDVGLLGHQGGNGGVDALAAQPMIAGPMTLFDGWLDAPPSSQRAAIARGQVLFNTARDTPGGTCAGCHNAANVGTSTIGRFSNIRISKPSRRTPEQPLYTFRNKTTGELRASTDPGRALVTGKWSDMDRFKVPGLRGLAARPPYFHDGSVATLDGVVRLYEVEFGFVFTDGERADLVAFLAAL